MLKQKTGFFLGSVVVGLLLVATATLSPSTFFPAQGLAANPNAPEAQLGTVFTYQGYLTDNGVPANGDYDFQFSLFDAAAGGAKVGSTVTVADLSVTDGMFTAALDFGNMFDGSALYLEMGVRAGSSTGAYTTLSPRQPLAAVPYALGLIPGAIIENKTTGPALALSSNGDGLFVCSTGSETDCTPSGYNNGLEVGRAENHGIRVEWAGLNGLAVAASGYDGIHVANAGGHGMSVNTAGDNGLEIGSAASNGVHIGSATYNGVIIDEAGSNGIFINSAGFNGVRVFATSGNGLHVDHANGNGLFVCSTGSGVSCIPTELSNGLEVGSAEDAGVYVDSADIGLYVKSASNYGVEVYSANIYGFYAASAGFDGMYVGSAGEDGVDVAGGNLAGYFRGNIQVTGSCTGCLLAAFAVNTSDETLQPGDLVTIQGTRPSRVDSVPMLMEVTRATEGQAVVGVVQGWAELVTEEDPRPTEVGLRLVPRDGAADPGAYVSIIIYGPVQVQASALGGAITPGTKLTLDAEGLARPLKTVEVEGVQLAESAPTIGLALSAPDENGLVWVLLNPQ